MAEPVPFVTFDFATWIATYPEFAAVSPAQGQAWFNLADLYFQNEACNPAAAAGLTRFAQYLYMLTSHIAWLNAPRDVNGNPAETGSIQETSLVGRISSASEGSVSVSTEFNAGGSPSEAFFLQTKYGVMFWQATAQYRAARYVPNPTIVPGTGFPYIGRAYRGRWPY